MTNNNEWVIERVFGELKKAEEKFPGWPTDPIHAAAIVAEEAGELVQAAIDFTYSDDLPGHWQMEEEAAQCAAMGIRFLLGLKFCKANKPDQPELRILAGADR